MWHCRKHKHVFDKTRFWDHLHLVTRIETAVGLDLVVNRPKVKRIGSWCSALGKIRPIMFSAPRKCYSVSVPNWGTSKKTTPILSEAQKRPRYWKNCLLPPSVFFRQREYGKLDGRRISIAEGFRHHGIDGVLLRAQHTGLNHRFGRHRRIFGRQILGNPEPPRAPPQELHELHHSKWWVNSQPAANFSKGSEFSVRIDFCTDEPRDVESLPESFPGSRIWRETCHAQGPRQDMAPFQNFLVGGERSERGRWSSILYTEIYPLVPIFVCAAGSQAIVPRATLRGKLPSGILWYTI